MARRSRLSEEGFAPPLELQAGNTFSWIQHAILLLTERNGKLLENLQKSVAAAVTLLLIIRGQALGVLTEWEKIGRRVTAAATAVLSSRNSNAFGHDGAHAAQSYPLSLNR